MSTRIFTAGFLIGFWKAQRTNTLSFDEYGDELAVIIGTFGALFGGILTYAGLKRGCDLIFGPKKDK